MDTTKLIFIRVKSMRHYQGPEQSGVLDPIAWDEIVARGAINVHTLIAEDSVDPILVKNKNRITEPWVNGDHEVYNFLPTQLEQDSHIRCYGGFYPHNYHKLNLTKIGGNNTNGVVSGVTVVFFTNVGVRQPVVVGFYVNADVYREEQSPKHGMGNSRIDAFGNRVWFHFAAEIADCQLIPINERNFNLLTNYNLNNHRIGMSNVWYGGENNVVFKREVLNYIQTRLGRLPANPS